MITFLDRRDSARRIDAERADETRALSNLRVSTRVWRDDEHLFPDVTSIVLRVGADEDGSRWKSAREEGGEGEAKGNGEKQREGSERVARACVVSVFSVSLHIAGT